MSVINAADRFRSSGHPAKTDGERHVYELHIYETTDQSLKLMVRPGDGSAFDDAVFAETLARAMRLAYRDAFRATQKPADDLVASFLLFNDGSVHVWCDDAITTENQMLWIVSGVTHALDGYIPEEDRDHDQT